MSTIINLGLGRGCFYTFSGFEHCSSAVVGQSRPALVVGENPDGTFDVQVFTNGRADGFIQSVFGVQGVTLDVVPSPGCLSEYAARGSTAKQRQEEQDELARVELARVVAEAEAKQAAERAAAKATEDARQAELDAYHEAFVAKLNADTEAEAEKQKFRDEVLAKISEKIDPVTDVLDVFEATRASRERATTAVMDADDAKTPPDPVAPEAEQSAPVATPDADPSSTP